MIRFFEKEARLSWFITLTIAGTIFYISTLVLPPGTGGTNILAILYHLFAFFFLGFFLLISLVKGKNKNLIIMAIIVAIAYAISDELHQYFVPGRSCAFSDVLLNSIGILSASLIYGLFLLVRTKKSVS